MKDRPEVDGSRTALRIIYPSGSVVDIVPCDDLDGVRVTFRHASCGGAESRVLDRVTVAALKNVLTRWLETNP